MRFVVTLSEAIGVVVLLGVVGFLGYHSLREWYRQKRCSHETYFENRACHAICRGCGLDLGFIGTVREKRKQA